MPIKPLSFYRFLSLLSSDQQTLTNNLSCYIFVAITFHMEEFYFLFFFISVLCVEINHLSSWHLSHLSQGANTKFHFSPPLFIFFWKFIKALPQIPAVIYLFRCNENLNLCSLFIFQMYFVFFFIFETISNGIFLFLLQVSLSYPQLSHLIQVK